MAQIEDRLDLALVETHDALRLLAQPPDWLVRVSDEQAVAAALSGSVTELASGELVLHDCELDRARLLGTSVDAVYRLEVEAPDSQERRAIDLRASIGRAGSADPDDNGPIVPIGDEGWSHHIPQLRATFRTEQRDDSMPALELLSDPQASAELIEGAVRRGPAEYDDIRIESIVPNVVRYKRRSRCTVLYDLEFPPDDRDHGWPSPVVVKTKPPNGDGLGRTYRAMVALWASWPSVSTHVSIAEPLGFVADGNILLQGPVAGDRTLKDMIRTALKKGGSQEQLELEKALARTAVGLADLHACEVEASLRDVSWDENVSRLREEIEPLAQLNSNLGDSIFRVLDALDAVAERYPAEGRVPAHGSFRPAQVLIDGSEVGFIDFDDFCLAEPALDLGLFRGTAKDLGLKALRAKAPDKIEPWKRQQHLALLDELCDGFLARYSAESPVSYGRVWIWEAVSLLRAAVHSWTKLKFHVLGLRLELLAHHLNASSRAS